MPEAPDPVFGPRSAEEIARELAPLGLDNGERFPRLRGRHEPAQESRDAARALRALERSDAAPRRSPARSRTRPSSQRPTTFGGRSPSSASASGCCSPASSRTRRSRVSTRARWCSCRRRGPRVSGSGRGSGRCGRAARAQRHPGAPRDAGRCGGLLPARATRPRWPSSSTSFSATRRCAPRLGARRGSAWPACLGRSAAALRAVLQEAAPWLTAALLLHGHDLLSAATTSGAMPPMPTS